MAALLRVEIGFDGGQVVAIKLDEAELAKLRQALAGGAAGWHEIASEDGAMAVSLSQVVFVKLAGGEHSVGFSGA